MGDSFRKRFWRTGRWLVLVFVLMFALRLINSYVGDDSTQTWQGDLSNDFFGSVTNIRKNYASDKMVISNADISSAPQQGNNQKYEKTATIRSKSWQFEEDANLIRTKSAEFNGVIQYEQNTGNTGFRQLHLLIGIQPERFDAFYETVLQIGKVRLREITKIDKTNEYRQLKARKTSLEKGLNSLNELKAKGGAITDFVQLHDKILEIENQMQELGVELGNFDSENEFCTVKFSLYESEPEQAVGHWQRIMTALVWTIQFYALLILSLLMMVSVVFIVLLIVEKTKLLRNIAKRMNE